jgi:hypothetical protein
MFETRKIQVGMDNSIAPAFSDRPIRSRGRFFRLRIAGLSLVAFSFVSSSIAAASDCVKAPKACGCSITSSGVYTLEQDLAFSGVGDCLSIKAKNVVLNLNGFNITGPGEKSTGSAVHVRNVENVWVEGQGSASQPSIIRGWKYGIEDDGNQVLIKNVSTIGNSSAGIYVFKATNSEIVDFESSNNSGYGVWLSSGSGNRVGSGTTSSNVSDGVFVGCVGNGAGVCASAGGNATSNTLYNLTSTNNGGGGIRVQFNSNFNQIGDCVTSGNTNYDLIDRHTGSTCGRNLWFANIGTKNEACIQ